MDEIEDEYRRLLYVAMTRAAERLIIAGVQPGNRNDVPKGSWYQMIRDSLPGSGLTERLIETRDGPIRRFVRPEDEFIPVTKTPAVAQAELPLMPHWLREQASAPIPAFELRRPSDAGDEEHRRYQRSEWAEQREHARRLLQSPSKRIAIFDAWTFSPRLVVRNWRPGDRFAPAGMDGKQKKLQDFFTDNKLSRIDRQRIPLLAAPEGILWVAGHRADQRFMAGSSTTAFVMASIAGDISKEGRD